MKIGFPQNANESEKIKENINTQPNSLHDSFYNIKIKTQMFSFYGVPNDRVCVYM